MIRRVLIVVSLLVIYAWTLHTVVLAGNALLAQHPTGLLLSSVSKSHNEPPDGVRQAVNVAEALLPAKASVAIVHRTNHFNDTYLYYWATYKMYPRHVTVTDDSIVASQTHPDYILDIADPESLVIVPLGYHRQQIIHFYGGTVLTVLGHA